MKKLIFVFAVLITSQIVYSQENKLLFSSELEFINSWYGSDAILKYRGTISPRLVIPCEECTKLKGVYDFKNPQQALYKKYETILSVFDKSFCLVPKYFLKHKDGTYTLMMNFIDLGMTTPVYISPVEVMRSVYKQVEPIIYGLSILCASISKSEISRIQMSVVYTESGDVIGKPNIIAFSTNRINIDNYHNGKITESQFFSKVRLYHTTGADFMKIQ